MCGLIGYVGHRSAQAMILAGLERLEYRGYDSSGLCLLEDGRLAHTRAVGRLDRLRERLTPSAATAGMGHTRWATHGRVCLENAHPLTSCRDEECAVVLNGIVENFAALRARLEANGHVFRSETDAEAVAHLVEDHYDGDLARAVAIAARELQGHYAFIVAHRDHADQLVATRHECPLVVGLGDGEAWLSSMIGAFRAETSLVQVVEDDELVVLQSRGARFFTYSGIPRARGTSTAQWEDEVALKDGFDTYMAKEIHEQPDAVARTLAGRLDDLPLLLAEAGLTDGSSARLERVVILACGTAYHAGLVGRCAFEDWAGLPCDVEIASEWRYRRVRPDTRTLAIAVTQSGETADTLAALRRAREQGARTLALTNTPGSQVTREAEATLLTYAGIEMGVAATKTFTAQSALLLALALALGEHRAELTSTRARELVVELGELPRLVARFLRGDHPIESISERYHDAPYFFFLGRHAGFPICVEGALKLKEVAYIPSEAYAAGEMKHGPIALIDETTTVVCIATDGHVHEKMLSNIQETRARGGKVIAIAGDGNEAIQHLVDDVIYVPRADPLIQAVLGVVPLQVLAHQIATLRGLDVDRPRNLAKTVTVE